MSETHVPGYWEVPATVLIVDPVDDNDQVLANELIEGIVEFAENNIEDEVFGRVKKDLEDFLQLLNENHLFLVLLCWAPNYKMLLPFTLGNFDLVLKGRLETLIGRAVSIAGVCKSDGFQVQRFTKENEDVEKVITSMIQKEMQRVDFRSFKVKDDGHGPTTN